MYNMRNVSIPNDARVFEESNGKYKSDKLILSRRFTIFNSKRSCLEAVKQNGLLLKYIERQNPEICLVAIKQNSDALQYVKEQLSEICLEAVKQNSYAFRYIKTQILEILKIYLSKKEIKNCLISCFQWIGLILPILLFFIGLTSPSNLLKIQ